MKITIIGWYGTETIGDRAILAGLFSFFSKAYGNFEVKLGSLYPFFSERTINEDYELYKEIIGSELRIEIFNSKNSTILTKAIKNSDLVVMGGGPLMDLDELFMVEYAFKKSRRLGVKTAVLGSGIGPLFHKRYQKSVLNIIKYSDLTILRDYRSRDNIAQFYQSFNSKFEPALIHTSYDPSVECILEYNKYYTVNSKDYIAVNLRHFPLEYNIKIDPKNINDQLEKFVKNLSEKYSDSEIKLIPMHYFHIGGDDRFFLNSISLNLKQPNIIVQNSNLTLKETLHMFRNAYFSIGMRFHSVVFQTITNGKNYVLDYTEPKKGKISGFINDIDINKFYDNRYILLQDDNITSDIIENVTDKFNFDRQTVEKKLHIYIEELKNLGR